jgi:hypothetical protein
MLALVFNVTNVVGFTYAFVLLHILRFSLNLTPFTYFFSSDRDAKKRWDSSNWSMGGLRGQMLTSVVKNSVGRVFGS